MLRAGARFCTACGAAVPVEAGDAPIESPAAAGPPQEARADAPGSLNAPAKSELAPAVPPPAEPAPGAPPPAPGEGPPGILPTAGSADTGDERPPAVPRAAAGAGPATVTNAPAVPPPPPPPPPKAFETYNALPLSRPPVDDAPPDDEPVPPLEPPAPAPPATVAPAAAFDAPPAPEAPPRPQAPALPREGWSTGRVIAVAATVVLLAGSLVAALVLGGGDDRKPESGAAAVASTPPPQRSARPAKTPVALATQVRTLDDLMKASQAGRDAAVAGDTKAAIANRTKLLKALLGLNEQASDAKLKAGLHNFTAAIRESLRQNRECGADCPAAELNQVNRLKQRAVERLNPLLRKYAKTSYSAREI